MEFQRTPMARAIMATAAALPLAAFAQTDTQTLAPVVVHATPFSASEDSQILTPAKILTGNELRDKLGNTLGETLSHELGVSASAFGAGASRPIIRGMEGPRVKILQNGMSVSDVSSLSNDHAVAADFGTARQIEILRGPAALLYGSGAIGGLVNIVNERIPTMLLPRPTGEAEVRASSADRGKAFSFSADGAAGKIGLHLDAQTNETDDYRIPGLANPADPASASGRLPNSFTRRQNLGLGISHVDDWGHIGASIGVLDDHYGIPTDERAYIDLHKKRFDVDGLFHEPLPWLSSIKLKLGATDYRHTEKEPDGTPATDFLNRAVETRIEATHVPLAGWQGSFGLQTEYGNYSALAADTGAPNAVPKTRSTSIAGFLVEERDFGPVRVSAGARLESVKRDPDAASGFAQRSFTLASYSLGSLWQFMPGYGAGLTYSLAQRAPSTEELYSGGPHESTATFDIGDSALTKETSRNIELSLQKTEGLVRWKANLFHNQVSNFIYGRTTGVTVDEDGGADPTGEFTQRFWSQGDAVIHGAEAEISYNLRGEGWSVRGFADTSRGRLEGNGSLPLQPATRYGIDLGYRQGAWRSGLSVLHAQRQDRLASFETFATPAYTQVDANLSWKKKYGSTRLTWFALAKNLLNEDIRVSTSILRDRAPLAGRNLVLGMRVNF
ncbi:iron complex outermembrane receptor protein [Paucimonas lemoignei]|uniref:Iron complex outermembrane receptor protein n=1 Tax=Paucimonas lemoignei TaxID=29443 RepID=A0A4R3HZ08_PAULE|nr:TonB-dependent receptor [Paucimonas lemoignei]TCS38596.1 iron complex outermembrane receptor protein [Paucimonas lemoignei]